MWTYLTTIPDLSTVHPTEFRQTIALPLHSPSQFTFARNRIIVELNRTKPTNLFISFLHCRILQVLHHHRHSFICGPTYVRGIRSTEDEDYSGVHSLKRNFNRRPQLLPSPHHHLPLSLRQSVIRVPLNCSL